MTQQLLNAAKAVIAQVEPGEIGRYADSSDYYAEVPWDIIDELRAAIEHAEKTGLKNKPYHPRIEATLNKARAEGKTDD